MSREQFTDLARPFPKRLIHPPAPGAYGDYVAHHVVTQKILAVVGPFDTEVTQVIRGHVPGIAPNPNGNSKRAKDGRPALDDAVVGVLGKMTLTIDGEAHTVEEAGDVGDPHNWAHDGQRLKDAMSDLTKRCAMRFGVGLHMWTGDDPYFLHDYLLKQEVSDDGDPDTVGETTG